jgi:hypothetical protein
MTIRISKKAWGNHKITPDGKVERDTKAEEAKLDVSTRLKRRNSKKTRPARKGEA